MTSKSCFKCGHIKPLDDFYRHSAMKDGHLGKCKECTKADVCRLNHLDLELTREKARLRYRAKQEVVKQVGLSAEEKARRAKAHAASAAKYPERRKAKAAVNDEIRAGRMVRWPCCALPECDKPPQAHHPDYSRPLDVVWLCVRHHAAAHSIARNF